MPDMLKEFANISRAVIHLSFMDKKNITVVSTVEQFHAAGLVKFIEERFTECAYNIQQDISVYQTIAALNDVD